MRLVPIKIADLTPIEITPLQITVSGEEILADLNYPAAPGGEPRP